MSIATGVSDGPNNPESVSFNWGGTTGLVGLSFKIFFLRILTLGIYYFWGKTEARRRIWSAIHLQNQPLQYTGTGGELFLGYIIVLFLVFQPIFIIFFTIAINFGPESPALIVAQVILTVVFLYFIGVAIYRARNYRLSRTTWRGIRGQMVGSSWKFGWTYFWTSIVSMLTLGWLGPWQAVYMQRLLTDDTRFGESPMQFVGTSKPLYLPFAVAWFGAIIIMGLAGGLIYFIHTHYGQEYFGQSSADGEMMEVLIILAYIGIVFVAILLSSLLGAWYQSRMFNLFAAGTTLDQGRFRLATTTGGVMWLYVSNFLILLLTLFILTPVVQSRITKYFIDRLSFDGTIDFTRIAQSQQPLSKTGEGMAEGFEIDIF